MFISGGSEQYECDVAIRKASLLCWFYCPDFEPDDNIALSTSLLRHATRDFAADFYPGDPVDPDEPSTALVDFLRLDVVPALGASPYLQRLLITLKHDALLNDSLISAVSSTCRTMANHPALLAGSAPTGILSALVDAVNKQALLGDPDTQSQTLAELVGMYRYMFMCLLLRLTTWMSLTVIH